MDKFTKLSDAMEAAAPYVEEVTNTYQQCGIDEGGITHRCGCAIGTALFALGIEEDDGSQLYPNLLLAERFGIDWMILVRISDAHHSLRKTRAEIIAELKAEGL